METDQEKPHDSSDHYGGLIRPSMDEVEECTRKLLEAIRESDVCRSYTEAIEKLDESPELRKTINEFRKRCYEIQNKEKSDQISQHLEQLEKDFY